MPEREFFFIIHCEWIDSQREMDWQHIPVTHLIQSQGREKENEGKECHV